MQEQPRNSKYKDWLCGIIAGLLAGAVLGLAMKAMQAMSGKLVYTLLLNIDFLVFVPILSELNEFSLHLLISIILGVVFRLAVVSFGHPLYISLFVSLMTAMLWIPLTLVSERVPAVDDFAALGLWLLGHLLFGLILYVTAGQKSCLLLRIGRRKSSP